LLERVIWGFSNISKDVTLMFPTTDLTKSLLILIQNIYPKMLKQYANITVEFFDVI